MKRRELLQIAGGAVAGFLACLGVGAKAKAAVPVMKIVEPERFWILADGDIVWEQPGRAGVDWKDPDLMPCIQRQGEMFIHWVRRSEIVRPATRLEIMRAWSGLPAVQEPVGVFAPVRLPVGPEALARLVSGPWSRGSERRQREPT